MNAKERALKLERLKELLSYERATGLFRWKARTSASSRVVIGDVAGGPDRDGYIVIRVDGRLYLAHRLAVFYVTGEWPRDDVDHRDLNRSNNEWRNLRCATESQNLANQKLMCTNTSGFKGVSWDKTAKRWTAQIEVRGRKLRLGRFDTPEDAHSAYMAAAQKHFGEFARAA